MYELDECLKATRAIKDISEQIEEIRSRATSPKNQVITGMPRGSGGFGSKSDDFVIKLERLERKRRIMECRRDDNWKSALDTFHDMNVKAEHIHLMMFRFYCGLKWGRCRDIMAEEYPDQNWNMNKVFRIYRNVLSKTEHF